MPSRLYEAALPAGAWPNWVLGNHDQHRMATRIGPAQARVANMLLLTLRGTPTTYYGEEIGMHDVEIPPHMVQDPPALNQPDVAHIVGRDPERTPMQWDASPNAGFAAAGVPPWLPLAADYARNNVAVQTKDAASMLSLYRALAALRTAEPALHAGDFALVDEIGAGTDDLFAYLRAAPGADRFLIVLNLGGGAHRLDLSPLASGASIEVSTGMDRSGPVDLAALEIGPDEGLVLRLAR